MKLSSNFVLGRMNKSIDERLVRPGEYIDAVNVRLGSTEDTEIGSVENSKGNTLLVDAGVYNGTRLANPRTIGAYEDGTNEIIYWFIASDDLDMIVSYNVRNSLFTHHVVSATVLNFDKQYLITGVVLVNDLLIFTDNLNPPRKININRDYPTPNFGVDQITEEDINLIVKPPENPPSVSLFNNPGTENFLEDTFVQFAYRYKYKDGEYSAISRFTDVAFSPGSFNYDATRAGNSGMQNAFNAAKVTFNTGDSNVIGIDLLFIESNKPSVNVIERFDKKQYGYSDNQEVDFVFANGQVYTVLPESEILRLFDNVPLKAKALTLMGNRLMFGNYTEGYDLVDENGAPINISFEADLIQEEFGFSSAEIELPSVQYTLGLAYNQPEASIELTFDEDIELVSGAGLSVVFNITGAFINGDDGTATKNTTTNRVEFIYNLENNYLNVYELVNSQEFRDAVTSDPLTPITDCGSANQGTTWTDILVCTLANTPPIDTSFNWVADEYGITSIGQGIQIQSNIAEPNKFTLVLPAIRFTDSGSFIYQYYELSSPDSVFSEQGDPSSLHSNRDYEVGIVYMDDYGRSSTALTSIDNSVYTPADSSITKNTIQATIPVQQKPPSWATKYKFVLKRVQADYETIYSQSVYTCPDCENIYYYKLEGDNQTKAAVGDTLIVKRDADGALEDEVQVEVLDIQAEGRNFLNDDPTDSGSQGFIPSPAGLYMQLKPLGFNGESDDPYALVDNGNKSKRGNYPLIYYPVFIETLDPALDPLGVAYDLPQGSRVTFDIKFRRRDRDSRCGEERYIYEKSFVAGTNYDNLRDFVIGENIDFTGGEERYISEIPNENIFYSDLEALNSNQLNAEQGKNKYQFVQDTDPDPSKNNQLYLGVRSGSPECAGFIDRVRAGLSVHITVERSDSLFIFETKPLNTDLDLYYEGSEAYDIQNGFHLSGGDTASGEQNQTASSPAIVNLSFFDCYSFGNGAEGYKILDGLDANSFSLGARTTSVAAEEYKEAHRLASITYSGIYNNESNINKLNEFNLGLANFKDLEESFGAIQILDSRQTDVLVLQVDRISYVLAGKNLLSDAAAGGAVTSVPEVLGTQITRVEEYGISQNPESFVSFGSDRYFTDAKRGAVLNIKGTTYSSDSLIPISELGMRSWFRDLFVASYNTFKLGAFDPYMNEYVLSSTTQELPLPPQVIPCGSQIDDIVIKNGDTQVLLIDVGNAIGDVNFSLTPDRTVDVVITFGSITQNYTINPTTGTQTFTKSLPYPEQISVAITASNGQTTINPLFSCIENDELTVISICLTEPEDETQTITNQYYWSVTGFNSPIQSQFITFDSGNSQPLVSSYNSRTGDKSVDAIPADNSTITIISNKLSTNDFVFDTNNNKLRYLSSNTLYSNSQSDIINLLKDSNLTNATPILNPSNGEYEASFNYNFSNTYLYLIWDYRRRSLVDLCSGTTTENACCDCASGQYYNLRRCDQRLSETNVVAEYTSVLSIGDFVEIVGQPNCVYRVTSTSDDDTNLETISSVLTGISDCTEVCNKYRVTNTTGSDIILEYYDCSGAYYELTIAPSGVEIICATIIENPGAGVTINVSNCDTSDCAPENNFLLRRCDQERTDTEVIASFVGGTASVGDFVVIVNEPNCVYTVVETTNENATETIASRLSSISSCNEVCNQYTLTNNGVATDFIDYIDCNGLFQEIGIATGDSETICAKSITTIDPNTSITLIRCGSGGCQ